jgi:hypothetical protein
VLSLASTRQRAPKSVLDQAFTQPAPVSAPAAPAAGKTAPNAAGGVNLTPAAPTTAPATTPPAEKTPAAPTPAKP